MTRKNTTTSNEDVVKSASPLVGATALARIFRRYERRRCRDTIRIWFANAVLTSPLKRRHQENTDKNTTSWALVQVWKCATRTKVRAVRTMTNLLRRRRRDLLRTVMSRFKSWCKIVKRRDVALKRVDIVIRRTTFGRCFRRWLVYANSRHLLSNHTDRTVRDAICAESTKWESKILKAKEAALRVVEQSRANTKQKIQQAKIESLRDKRKHSQHVAIRVLDSMMRLARLRALSSKFRKWHLLSLNLALYVYELCVSRYLL